MMKLGLLTFHYANNYGALLQTYATLLYLSKNGYDVNLIDLRPAPTNKFISFIYSFFFNKNFYTFRKKYFSKYSTKLYYTGEKLSEFEDVFDVFIVGSDQVWRTKNTKAFGFNYFLDFVKEKKKVSYSSSFGVSEWEEPEVKEKVAKLLTDFSAISVREDKGITLCKREFNIDAVKVVDPTLLLDADDYREIYRNKFHLSSNEQPYIACFFLDYHNENMFKSLVKYSNWKGLKIKNLAIPKFRFKGMAFNFLPKTIEEWLGVLDNSDVIITESFHCVVFALIFRKKFICIKNERRGLARLESLLGLLGLEYLFISFKELSLEKIDELVNIEIDYVKVWEQLDQEINFSKNFIKENLSK